MFMKSALEVFRIKHGLTFRELAGVCGVRGLNAVYRHCKGEKIPAEAALLYHQVLGIPLCELLPENLWPPKHVTPISPTNSRENESGGYNAR